MHYDLKKDFKVVVSFKFDFVTVVLESTKYQVFIWFRPDLAGGGQSRDQGPNMRLGLIKFYKKMVKFLEAYLLVRKGLDGHGYEYNRQKISIENKPTKNYYRST